MNSSKENDIFNKVMLMPILKSMLIFCKKHKEIFMYLFFGGLGVSINIIFYHFSTSLHFSPFKNN